MCLVCVCVCVLDKLIILSKFVTEKERIHYTYTYSKIIVFVVLLSLYIEFVCYFDSLSENENLNV